jgi:hypothetical protein
MGITFRTRSSFYSLDKQNCRKTYFVSSVQDYCRKSVDTFAASGCLYEAHALVHLSDALGATACDIGCQAEWLICSMVKLNYITDMCSFRPRNGRIILLVLFEQWDPGINHAFSSL